jgi:hypothetical protein
MSEFYPPIYQQKTADEMEAYARQPYRETAKPSKLVEHVRLDETGRKIREFTGPKHLWMDAYKSPPQLQLRINNRQTSFEENEAFAERWHAMQRGEY